MPPIPRHAKCSGLCILLVLGVIIAGASSCADPDGNYADVVEVTTSGIPSQTVFTVTIASPDTGCERYADWWEVLDAKTGALVTRRILGHSHVDEQPFTRSSPATDVGDTQRLVVRAHMNHVGYGGVEFTGSLATGFAASPNLSGGSTAPAPTAPACAF